MTPTGAAMNALNRQFTRYGRQGAHFVAAFGAAKAFAYFGPLLLARLMAPSDYGAVELAFSVGLIVSIVASLGVTGAIPILHLIRDEQKIEDLLLFYVASVACTAFVAGVGAYLMHYAATGVLLCAIAASFGLQGAASCYTRVKKYRLLSGWADNLTLSLISLLGLAEYAVLRQIRLGPLAALVLLGAAALAAAAGALFVALKRDGFLAAYRRAIGVGFFIMVNSFLMSFVVGGMRIFVGWWLSLADVGAYSLCARVNLYLLLFHQLVTTWFYTKLLTWTVRQFDRMCSAFVIFLSVAAVFGVVAFDRLVGIVMPHGSYDLQQLRVLFPVVAMQTILWVVTAQLEVMIYREGVASRSVAGMGIVLAGLVGSGATLHAAGELTLLRMCLLFNGFLVIVVLVQLGLLWYHRIRLTYTLIAMPSVLAPLSLSLFA
jgi:O-antigen/teichoic acid export membrane protein